MKKVVLVFTLFIICMTSFGQSIAVDKTDKDARYIITSKVLCRNFTDRVVYSFGMSAIIIGDEQVFNLELDVVSNGPLTVEKGSHILIKTFEGNVIELTSTSKSSDNLGTIKDIGGTLFTSYTIHPSYSINPAQIDSISKEGVAKIRVETSIDYLDKEYKKDKAGIVIAKDYELIKDAINTKKSLRDGF